MINKTIGIDLGGTRIKAVLLDNCRNVIDEKYQDTFDGDDRRWKETVAALVNPWRRKFPGEQLVAGIAAPGLPNNSNTAIAHMPGRLQGLENFEWSIFLDLPCVVLNDAVAAMMAEARLGAGRKSSNMVMLTLGTGVGGAILVNGQPYLGAFGKAGHMGHMVINDEGDPDVCGMPGSLEDAIGNITVHKRSGGKFNSTKELLDAMHNGDEYAQGVWEKSVRKLAIGIASVTNILSPEIVVIGGGIAEAGKDLFEPLDKYMAKYEWRTGGNKATILRAELGDMAGAIGAACYALEKNNKL